MSSSKLLQYHYVIGGIPKKQNKIPILGNVYSLISPLCHLFIKNFNRWERPDIYCCLIIEGSTIFLITQGGYGFSYDKEYLLIYPNIRHEHIQQINKKSVHFTIENEKQITNISMKPEINFKK